MYIYILTMKRNTWPGEEKAKSGWSCWWVQPCPVFKKQSFQEIQKKKIQDFNTRRNEIKIITGALKAGWCAATSNIQQPEKPKSLWENQE